MCGVIPPLPIHLHGVRCSVEAQGKLLHKCEKYGKMKRQKEGKEY
jgi:hypothetical protein